MAKKSSSFDYVEPVGARVLVRKDEPKRETRGESPSPTRRRSQPLPGESLPSANRWLMMTIFRSSNTTKFFSTLRTRSLSISSRITNSLWSRSRTWWRFFGESRRIARGMTAGWFERDPNPKRFQGLRPLLWTIAALRLTRRCRDVYRTCERRPPRGSTFKIAIEPLASPAL